MSTLPTGTITFLMTDIEGSTQLWEAQPDAMRADLERHDAHIRGAIESHGGSVFKTGGDAFCAAFDGPERAIGAALAAQIALSAQAWTVPGLRVRMALHTGEAQARGGDYFGPPLNRTARLRDAAHGGQILLSQATAQLAGDDLPPGAALRDLGRHRLKDLARPEQVFQAVHPEIPDGFPRLRSLDALPNNLPQRLDSFIGRERELAQVEKLLASSRLLTLTGVGGAGKTRLAQQTAADGADDFPQGVWLVALESLSDPALVPQAVAQALNLREQPGIPLLQTLCDALQGQALLLLLDNCEHVIAACAHLAETLLQSCPRLRVLATSREPLGIRGEAVYPVPTLVAPGAGEVTGDEAAVRLFVDRATLSLPSFTLTARNAPAVTRICRQLDGIPLAIELAAPRVRTLTPEQISSRLGADFRLLSGGSRTALPRQQTMQAAIQWSHDLLSEPERLLFRRLSVFAGGWTLEAAETVCAGDGLDEWDVLDLLSSLASKSLVQADEERDGAKRYRMLETLRQYGGEQLLASSRFDAVRDRHRDWFVALAERAEPHLRGPDQKHWLDCLEADHDNLRAVLKGTLDLDARLRLASALFGFWLTRGFLSEGRDWLASALAETGDVGCRTRARALTALGALVWSQSDYPAALACHRQAQALYQECGDRPGVARSLKNIAIVLDYRQDFENARQNYEECLATYRELGDPKNVASVLLNLGAHWIERGEPDPAMPFLQEAMGIWQGIDDQSGVAWTAFNLGRIALLREQWPEAISHFQLSLRLQAQISDQRGIAAALYHVALTNYRVGRDEAATPLMASADALVHKLNAGFHANSRLMHEETIQSLRLRLGEDRFAALWQEGAALSVPKAVETALTE